MRREQLWKVVALVATSMTVGTMMVGTPAGADVAGWAHNWTEHIRPRTDARYYTKTQANMRYHTKAEVYTKSQSDARFVSENELPWAVHEQRRNARPWQRCELQPASRDRTVRGQVHRP